ncbi:16S rRNA (guanine(527)-N(7))-methyltransferase RsmG [Porphyromonadaceae bacterium]
MDINSDIIKKYFPSLTQTQTEQFEMLGGLYNEWNERINVISRKDIENLYERHILHSLAIAKFITFKKGTSIVDVGTGGGFPGIPLAILFPEVSFHLVDRIGKKIRVATEVVNAVGLQNTTFRHCGIEEEKRQFDFVVSRAVMPLSDLYSLCKKNISPKSSNAIPNGLITLKGGELNDEIKSFKKIVEVVDLSVLFHEPFFETKKIVFLPH